jgi:hypothetical protein
MKATTRTYLVECYSPGIARDDVESAGSRATEASAALRGEGCRVDYVGALLVPADEVVFHVFASGCAGAVREASLRAAVEFERVVESVAVGSLQLRREK